MSLRFNELLVAVKYLFSEIFNQAHKSIDSR